MKVPCGYAVEKVISKDKEAKEVYRSVFLDTGRGVLFATDGLKAIMVPVEVDIHHDKPGVLPLDAIDTARQDVVALDQGFFEIMMGDKAVIENQFCHAEYARVKHLDMPKIHHLFPTIKPKFEIAFNVKHLKTLADAMGEEVVAVKFFGKNYPLLISPLDENNGPKAIMLREKSENEDDETQRVLFPEDEKADAAKK